MSEIKLPLIVTKDFQELEAFNLVAVYADSMCESRAEVRIPFASFATTEGEGRPIVGIESSISFSFRTLMFVSAHIEYRTFCPFEGTPEVAILEFPDKHSGDYICYVPTTIEIEKDFDGVTREYELSSEGISKALYTFIANAVLSKCAGAKVLKYGSEEREKLRKEIRRLRKAM